MGRTKYTAELLGPFVAQADSYADVVRRLGLAQAGGTQTHIARRVRQLGLDTSHFTRRHGRAAPNLLSPGEILVRIPAGSFRRKAPQLRRALLAIGRAWECLMCHNDGTWCGQKLTLHVDHIDGDFLNNLPENLRFLCPNCHNQTANFAGRSTGWRTRPESSDS